MERHNPTGLNPPVPLALARTVDQVAEAMALPGGTALEPKWDGFRVSAWVGAGEVELWSRQGKNLTKALPELANAVGAEVPPGFVLDGEAVIWADGRLDFDSLQRRLGANAGTAAALARARPASFVVFDLLVMAGTDIRGERFATRRQLLEELAREWPPPLHISELTTDPEEARQWMEDLAPAGIEGVVAKGLAQPYRGGQRDWVKVKTRRTVDVMVGAVIGPMRRPEALVLGRYVDGRLRIVGRTAPLRPATARLVGEQLTPPEEGHPWPAHVSGAALSRFNPGRGEVPLTLVEPVVAEVVADVATAGESFRHLVRFVRLRPELDAGGPV